MSRQPPPVPDLDRRDLGFLVAWLLALALLVPAQLASLILFDSTGLDVFTPDLVFTAVVPALALASLPTVVARRFYPRRTVLATVVVSSAVFALLAAYAMGFYGMCGPGC